MATWTSATRSTAVAGSAACLRVHRHAGREHSLPSPVPGRRGITGSVDVAARRARLDELGIWPIVERLSGLAAELDPKTLSSGERQLITLARAYLSPAPVVILDEATCHLDAMTEARVEAAFARRAGTLVVVAHRISSALRADQVLLLDADQVVLGSHEQLLAQSSLYRDLTGHWDWSSTALC